jgi:hypothetical protein
LNSLKNNDGLVTFPNRALALPGDVAHGRARLCNALQEKLTKLNKKGWPLLFRDAKAPDKLRV